MPGYDPNKDPQSIHDLPNENPKFRSFRREVEKRVAHSAKKEGVDWIDAELAVHPLFRQTEGDVNKVTDELITKVLQEYKSPQK